MMMEQQHYEEGSIDILNNALEHRSMAELALIDLAEDREKARLEFEVNSLKYM